MFSIFLFHFVIWSVIDSFFCFSFVVVFIFISFYCSVQVCISICTAFTVHKLENKTKVKIIFKKLFIKFYLVKI